MRCAIVLLLLLLLLTGCANPLRSDFDSWPRVGDELARTLRWADPSVAATFATPEIRDEFLRVFPADGSIKFVDVHHAPKDAPRGQKADGFLTVEYYRITSSVVKKAVLPLEWSCIAGGGVTPCVWRLSHLPDQLP